MIPISWRLGGLWPVFVWGGRAAATFYVPGGVLSRFRRRFSGCCLVLCALIGVLGCQPFDHYNQGLVEGPAVSPAAEPPRELSKVSMPAYRIEPPDVLQLEVQKLVPLPPYRVDTFDTLQINVSGTLTDLPIRGFYLVDGEGYVDLGPGYGRVRLVGMTIEQAGRALETHLAQILKLPEVSLQLARPSNVQMVNGVYLVSADGTINLRQYGAVPVAGKTVVEARLAIQRQLSRFFDSPTVSLDIGSYNSKVYYIILEGVADDDSVVRVPITGNETVLDALSQVHGLSQISSKKIWIARPAPYGAQCEQILPVDWKAVTRGGATATNYQIMPGDRVFVAHDDTLAMTAFINKIVGPFERVFGFSSMGASTIKNFQNFGSNSNSYYGY